MLDNRQELSWQLDLQITVNDSILSKLDPLKKHPLRYLASTHMEQV